MNYIDVIDDREYIGIGKYKDKSFKVYVPKSVINEQDDTYMPQYIRLSDLCFIEDTTGDTRPTVNNIPRYILADDSVNLLVIEMDSYNYDNSYMLGNNLKLITGEPVISAINTFPFIVGDEKDKQTYNQILHYMLPLTDDSAVLLNTLSIGYFVMFCNKANECVYIPITNRKLTDIELKKITAVSNAYKLLLKLKENC